MESLLDNPMKAVLYLKELTTIVQNQQSLIQTQRQRIDELERKVEDLIGENRQLRDPHQYHHHHPHHHHHPSPRTSSPQPAAHPHQHSATHGQAQPQQHPSKQPQHLPAAPIHHPKHLQLVSTSPPTLKATQSKPPSPSPIATPSPAASPSPGVTSTSAIQPEVQVAPQVAGSTVTSVDTGGGDGDRDGGEAQERGNAEMEKEDVRVQEIEQEEEKPQAQPPQPMQQDVKKETEELEKETASTGGTGRRPSLHHTASPIRVQRNGACCHSTTSDYELSLDLKNKQIEMLEHKYGGHLISRRAACKIQTAFRQYQLSKNFEKIRNSLLESRLPRRISLRKVRVQNTEGISAERALAEGCNLTSIPLVRSPSLPTTVGGSLTDLEDSFNEQVQSLAQSIDDALSNWSMKTMCSLQEGGTYQFSSEAFSTAGGKTGLAGTVREGGQLMMAFRDVTVQIDSKNFHVSSSVLKSSTSVSLGNCVQQGAIITESPQQPPVNAAKEQHQQGQPPAFPQDPAPPPLEWDAEEVLEAKRIESDTADNSSEQMSSSSTSTSVRSTSEVSSKEALQAMILSLPRYHCENPASCKSPTLSTDVMRKRLYRIGLNLFNINPDKGLQFLISRGFIPDTPIGVAHFLLQRKGLSRQMIGEFLGNSKKPFNRDVLDCVVDEMDFSGMELDEALRKFQAHIRVQGEAQKVERLIEAFSQRYCMCNPDVVQQFHNPDTIFILAFAIILLNTDMYSPNIKPDRKMMLEDFIRNLRGVDDGADIPRDMVVGIYERIQLRELRSNEDHVTYVSKVEQSIVGMKTVLSVPHRRLVCCSRLFEVTDINKAQKQAAHQREVFLFNDLLVILKLCPKKKSSAAYTFCKAMGLLGMQFHLFENEYYPHAITIVSPFSGSDKKQVLNFCAQSAEELLKFVEDLKESIAEVSEMEQIRIEWELEKQQGAKTHSIKNNGTQLELRGRQGSPSGTLQQIHSDTNVCVSIHNRLQTYQLNAALQSPERTALLNHQRELFQQPPLQCASPTPSHSYQPIALAEIRPDTLIQCQQIVKVIVLDKGSHGCMEAFLSQSPTHHQLIQSVVSTPVRSPDGGVNQGGNDGSQPPLPPPPPPYNHPHQYIPPDPRLALQRTPSGSRSLI
uniref:IQ motif and SEC7 domain-containing protein 3 n=1 Tax=Sinocyclocheilus anshuiensis TaxID=1608454 RepID=A0A671QTZ1_9TELE